MDSHKTHRFVLTILEFAIADERASQEKYKWLALNASRKSVQDIFLRLYQEERQHEKKMKNMLQSMQKALDKPRSGRNRRIEG